MEAIEFGQSAINLAARTDQANKQKDYNAQSDVFGQCNQVKFGNNLISNHDNYIQ